MRWQHEKISHSNDSNCPLSVRLGIHRGFTGLQGLRVQTIGDIVPFGLCFYRVLIGVNHESFV